MKSFKNILFFLQLFDIFKRRHLKFYPCGEHAEGWLANSLKEYTDLQLAKLNLPIEE